MTRKSLSNAHDDQNPCENISKKATKKNKSTFDDDSHDDINSTSDRNSPVVIRPRIKRKRRY